MPHNQPTGKLGEKIAIAYLIQKGLRLITSNFHSRFGEIDLIMLDGKTTVFVEVKARFGQAYGTPQSAVTPAKIQKIIKTAQYFKLLHPEFPASLRIDVVAITLAGEGEVTKFEHIKNVTS